jgi:hypothetical protein
VMFNADPDLGIDVRALREALAAELAELAGLASGRNRMLRAVGASAD